MHESLDIEDKRDANDAAHLHAASSPTFTSCPRAASSSHSNSKGLTLASWRALDGCRNWHEEEAVVVAVEEES